MLSDNYIHEVIKKNNHAFLLGLQGNNLLSFNPHTLSKRGLSYRTASLTLRNQEYAAFFNNMLDTLSGMADQERDVCIAYMAGYLCFFTIDQSASPYILFRVWQDLPAKCSSSRMTCHRRKVETTIDTVLLRSRCHMEPSQLNFEALTFVSRKDLSAIAYLMRQTIQTTYKYRISANEISTGVRNMQRQNIHLRPNNRFYHLLRYRIEGTLPILPAQKKKVYQDYLSDEHDYMNTDKKPWYTYPGCRKLPISPLKRSLSRHFKTVISFLRTWTAALHGAWTVKNSSTALFISFPIHRYKKSSLRFYLNPKELHYL